MPVVFYQDLYRDYEKKTLQEFIDYLKEMFDHALYKELVLEVDMTNADFFIPVIYNQSLGVLFAKYAVPYIDKHIVFTHMKKHQKDLLERCRINSIDYWSGDDAHRALVDDTIQKVMEDY